MNVIAVNTKGYENNRLRGLRQNKPNSNPIKANTKPIKANKMPNQSQYKPNQTQFQRQKNAKLQCKNPYNRCNLWQNKLLIAQPRWSVGYINFQRNIELYSAGHFLLYPFSVFVGFESVETIAFGSRYSGRRSGSFQMPTIIFNTQGFDIVQLPEGSSGFAGIFFSIPGTEMPANPASHAFQRLKVPADGFAFHSGNILVGLTPGRERPTQVVGLGKMLVT